MSVVTEPQIPGPSWQRGSKAKNLTGTIIRLIRYMGKYRYLVALTVIIGLVVTALSVLGPQYLGQMTDIVADSIESHTQVDLDAVFSVAIILVALYGTQMILEATRTRIEWVYEEIVGSNMRKDLSKKVSRLPVSTLDRMQTGDIMSRFVNDTDTIRRNGIENITRTIESIIKLIVCIAVMFLIDWRMALCALVPTVAGFVIMRIIIKFTQKYYRAQSRNLGQMNSVVEETYRGLDVVNMYNALDNIKAKFGKINDELFTTSFRSRMAAGIMPEIAGFMNNLGYVFVCIVGSVLILEGSATFGTLVAFIAYVRIINRPMMGLSNSLSGLQETGAAAERIFEFLDAPEMDEGESRENLPDSIRGEIVFDDVSFSYIPGIEVLHHLDLHVAPGQRIAIVGPTGAGKTTMSNLLLRYYDPDSGRITIDGVDTTSVLRSEVRKKFSVVLQDTWLFKGTLRQNLVFGNDDVPDERLMEVCDAVGLGHFVRSLPQGLDTEIVGPHTLSSGQRQQITIARAIVKDAPLLIMDEATSSVDTRTEHAIQDAMDRLMKGRTSFVIAHRLSTIKSADHIIVIRKGEIIERGTHEEPLAKGGFYRSLYESQFEFCE